MEDQIDGYQVKLRNLMASDDDPDYYYGDPRKIFIGQYHPPAFPTQYCVGSRIKINVSQTATPYIFYFHFDEQRREIRDFYNCLQSFYSDPEQSYLRMNMNNIRLNRNCIAPYKGLWHRAKIVSIDELHRYRVKVFYVDFGTVDSVDANSLCFVHEYSSQLPIKAFRGCLNNIRPIEHDWDFASCKVFHEAVRYHSVYATLMAIDIDNQIYYLDMDESTKLVTEKKACHTIMPVYSPYHGLSVDIYPKFDDVEYGIFPTFRERYRTWKLVRKSKRNSLRSKKANVTPVNDA